MEQTYEKRISWRTWKMLKHFFIVFEMKSMKETSSYLEIQTKCWDQHTIKKPDPDVFILGKWYFCEEASLV